MNIKPEFWYTFYSLETGAAMARSFFLDYEGDNTVRIRIFRYNRAMWESIESDVKQWTLSNWDEWRINQPLWFTEEAISFVPDEFIPVDARLALDQGAVGGRRRRSSAGIVEGLRNASIGATN
jgi:hypothetical protein